MSKEMGLIQQTNDSGFSDLKGPSEMVESAPKPFMLVPEIALLEPLSEHLRKRFSHALYLMHKELDEHRTWEQIATASAISPYHFHREFTQLFNETPGRYLSRLRLQVSVSLLMSNDVRSVTEIAQYCGFSSSQALGKALKRELGVTAKQVRKMGYDLTPKEAAAFLNKLAHPGNEVSLEKQLAQSMPTEIVWYPKRGMKKLSVVDSDWDNVFERYGEKSVRLLGATPINQLEQTWDQIDTHIGDWQVEDNQYDFELPEGYYLCSEVYIVSDTGYSAALEAIFDIALKQQLEIDGGGYFVEMIRHIELTELGGVTFSLQVPIVK